MHAFMTVYYLQNVFADNSSVKLIVKVKPGYLPYVERVMQDYGFRLYRQIIDEIFTFESNYTVGDEIGKCITAKLSSDLRDQVEYMYESYDLFRPPQTSGTEDLGHTIAAATGQIEFLNKDNKDCRPIFGIEDAWERNITGKGVVIAITDLVVGSDQNDINKSTDLAIHGQTWAILAAGIRNVTNTGQPCHCRIAPDATIEVLKVGRVSKESLRSFCPRPTKNWTVESMCGSLRHRQDDIDIYSNSWHFDTYVNDKCILDSMKRGYYTGRNCKGNIYVFPADPPGNYFVNNIYTIAVGDMGVNGTLPENYETNSVLVSMFGSGKMAYKTGFVTNTDIMPNSSKCLGVFGGQHAASAMVSEVIALLLGVNPQLTVRDVKNILVESASNKHIAEEASFKTNGAGYKYHNVFGFGYPNVTKMISLAKSWTTPPDLFSCTYTLDIIGNTAFGSIQSQHIKKLEQVEIEVSFVSLINSSLTLEAISPINTTFSFTTKHILS